MLADQSQLLQALSRPTTTTTTYLQPSLLPLGGLGVPWRLWFSASSSNQEGRHALGYLCYYLYFSICLEKLDLYNWVVSLEIKVCIVTSSSYNPS